MEFGKKLRKLINDHGDSQESIAEFFGCSQNLISTWCSGKSEPSLSRARALAERFGVPLAYLADDAQDVPPPELSPAEESLILIFRSLARNQGLTAQEAVDRLTGTTPVPLAHPQRGRSPNSGAG